MELHVDAGIEHKITVAHGVSVDEVRECFYNRTGRLLYDTREKNLTVPVTQWFIAETNRGRWIKVCFIPCGEGNPVGKPILKTAYPPNEQEISLYQKYGYRPI
ncbi:ADP-ribosyl-(dinitrogen reductase) hydrolase [Nissabacter sp. SGAir0207]|uniref:ADP-ribosyl-(dinitrogen reductase) hydrolase n=1 Tax=Nissabacter sp. SGAir0207 TaxID=2126321 RepID=UPI0010CD37CB|nr:ADP-ribosyl-(dinitrogen reductase) hydrolase [Nissabacter sp. SGAir0207]QCR37967.1 ADP-ribosyl-(dinitrogen reductase) hydrolase [Nissabacter sp. SGAir0207]